jgi:phosphatidate cytidylyltransferase
MSEHGNRMHFKRWITGIGIGAPLLLLLVWPHHRWPFYTILYVAAVAGLREFYALTSKLPPFVRISGYTLTLLLFLAISLRQLLLAPVIIALWVLVPMAYYVLTPPPNPQKTSDLGKATAGQLYVSLPLAILVWIDLLPKGNWWILFLLVVVFANDTGAFYLGRFFGKHKLYSAVSPNKTWEGAFGGLLSGLLAGLLYVNATGLHPVDIRIVVLLCVMSAVGQLGDLAESMLKRNHSKKDSGEILPGHGGILDRIDGVLFSIPVLFSYVYLSQTSGIG